MYSYVNNTNNYSRYSADIFRPYCLPPMPLAQPETAALDLSVKKTLPDSSVPEVYHSPGSSLERSSPMTSCGSKSPENAESLKVKAERPFKVISKQDLLAGISHEDEVIQSYIEDSARRYAEFRAKLITQLTSGTSSTNENMRRAQHNEDKALDVEYLAKRKKNNDSAKKSRDARKLKQDEIAIRAAFLEQEYARLSLKVQAETEVLERLRSLEAARMTANFK